MNNLCTSNEDSPSSFADATDRYEVSVQQVLSCNAGKEGCDGAWAYTANQAFLDHGISRERDHPYQCGAGNPLHHFEGSGSCKKWPWGGKCAKDNVADWIYGGALQVKGEDMLTVLSQGHALYMTMMVDDSFVFEDFTGKVYDGTNQYGSKGGHAMMKDHPCKIVVVRLPNHARGFARARRSGLPRPLQHWSPGPSPRRAPRSRPPSSERNQRRRLGRHWPEPATQLLSLLLAGESE